MPNDDIRGADVERDFVLLRERLHGGSFRPPRAPNAAASKNSPRARPILCDESKKRPKTQTSWRSSARSATRHDDGDGSGGRLKRASWRRTLLAQAQCLRKTAEFPLNQKSSGRIFLRPLSRNTAKGASRIQDVNGATSDTRSERVTFSSSFSSSSALSEW